MLFEFENDRLKKEAAVRVPLRAITAAILEVDSKYSTFLDSGDRDKRIELVRDGIEEICVRQAAINDLPAEQVIPAVLEHLASDSGDSIYEGIENSTVTAPKKVDLFEPIGGGDRTKWEEVPTNADGQREKFENLDVKETQKLLQGDTAPGKKSKIEHQDFEYGGFVDEAGKPGSLVGTRHDAEEFDPNDQGKHKDKYEMVGGEAGGQTNPESHKNIDKDNSDAKEVNPRSLKETEGKKKPKKSRVAASKCSTCGQSSECGCTDCRCSYCSSDHEAFAKNARGYQQDEDAAYDDFVEKEFQKAEETGGEARPGDNEKLKGLNQKQALNIMAPAPNGEDSRSDFAPPAQPRPQMDYEKQAPAPMDLPPSRGGDIGEGFGQPHSSEMAAMHDPALDAHLFASDFLRNNAEQFPPGSPEQKQMYYQLIHQHNQKTSAVPSDQAAQIGQQILNNLSLGMPTMRDLEQARQQLHQVSQRDPQLYSSLLGQLHQVAQQALAQAPPGKDQVDLNHFVMELGNTGNMMQQGVSPFPGGEEEVAPHVASTGEDNTETQEEPMTSSFSEEQKVDEQKRVASLRQAGYSEDEVAEIIHVVNNITLKTAATPWWMTGQGVPNAAPKAQAGPQLQQTHNAVPAAPYEKATPQQLQSQPHNWGGAYGGANQAQSQWWHGLNPTQQSAYVNSMKSPAPGATPQQQGATNFDIVKHPGMNPNYEQNIWNKLTPQQQAQFEPQAAGGPTGVANEIGGGLKAGITGPAGAIGAAGPLGEIAGGLKAGVTGPWNALGMDKTIPMPSAVNEVGGGLGAMATGPLGAAAGISSQANPLGEVAGGLGHMVTGPAGAIGNVLGL